MKNIMILIFSLLFLSCNAEEKNLNITDNTIDELKSFRLLDKFKQDINAFYPGAPSETIRLEAESYLNEMVDEIIAEVEINPTKSFVLSKMKNMLHNFDNYDSEEQDRIASYCEDIMDILGIESSDGLLNKWRYGF